MSECPVYYDHFRIIYDGPESQEPSKNLLGAHSSILTQSQQISCHGDPIHIKYYHFCQILPTPTSHRPAHFHYTSKSHLESFRFLGPIFAMAYILSQS